jgi:hypothetical protein
VSGLGAGNFKVFEDKQPQGIVDVLDEDGPISAGIFLDVRESLQDAAKRALVSAFGGGTRGDQYFLVESGKGSVGETVYQGLNKVLQEGSNPRRVFIWITDRDDAGAVSFSKVKELLKKQDLQMFIIGVPSVAGRSSDQDRDVLRDLSTLSGATSYFLSSVVQFQGVSHDIVRHLRNQYRLAYTPSKVSQDGDWRSIRIAVEVPDPRTRKLVKLNARARSGYYYDRELLSR